MRDVNIAITAASYSGNKGAAAMLESSIRQLHERYGERLVIRLMSVYPRADKEQVPFDFVKIVSTKPEQLVFIAFPLSVLYRIIYPIVPIRNIIKKNKIIKAYLNTDVVVDEAGISFVDERGFVMNTYAFICVAVPLLLKVPVVKYSQAMGTFNNPYNRFLAKWILPKLSLICARGEKTLENLYSIGIKDNVCLCADGAFTMKDDPNIDSSVQQRMRLDAFYTEGDIVGISISSVVWKKCRKKKIDYISIMSDFIEYLNNRGYKVLIIANAARLGSEKARNNDLMAGDAIYEKVTDKAMVRWYHEEMGPEEIRTYIGKCRFLVASRFHAMIGALQKKVPVFLIGWSHKYQEVLDMFELGSYSTDFSNLNLQEIIEGFEKVEENENKILNAIDVNYDKVMRSSYLNIQLISDVINKTVEKPYKVKDGIDYKQPEKYIGDYIALRKGYSTDEGVRSGASSGGLVTTLLCNMLRHGEIDGAWVTKTRFSDDHLTYQCYIATTEEEIRDAATSVYMDIPQLKELIPALRKFNGKVAVTLVPCMMRGLASFLEQNPDINSKVVIRIGLFCSGCYSPKANDFFTEQAKINTKDAVRYYYRKGHWRGSGSVSYRDGSVQTFSYTKGVCAYKNAYFFEEKRCTCCKDHFCEFSDISFGDIWNSELKKESVKYTSCVIRSQKGKDVFDRLLDEGDIVATHVSGEEMVRGQKRALVYKFLCTNNQSRRWNYKLVGKLSEINRTFSEKNPQKLKRIPKEVIYYYMCMIRALMSI